jgi:hypothetical protein
MYFYKIKALNLNSIYHSHNTLPDAPLFTRNLQIFNQLNTIYAPRFSHTATKELLTQRFFARVQSGINTGLFQNTVTSLYNFVTAVRSFKIPLSLSVSIFYFLFLFYFCLLSLLTLFLPFPNSSLNTIILKNPIKIQGGIISSPSCFCRSPSSSLWGELSYIFIFQIVQFLTDLPLVCKLLQHNIRT